MTLGAMGLFREFPTYFACFRSFMTPFLQCPESNGQHMSRISKQTARICEMQIPQQKGR